VAGWLGELGLRASVDTISGTDVEVAGDGNVWLPPYAYRWIVARPS
jgi:hypothetical protein